MGTFAFSSSFLAGRDDVPRQNSAFPTPFFDVLSRVVVFDIVGDRIGHTGQWTDNWITERRVRQSLQEWASR